MQSYPIRRCLYPRYRFILGNLQVVPVDDLAVGESAIDAFVYSVSDGNGGTATATVSVDVIGVNDNPDARDDDDATDEDTPITTVNVLQNDQDPDKIGHDVQERIVSELNAGAIFSFAHGSDLPTTSTPLPFISDSSS